MKPLKHFQKKLKKTLQDGKTFHSHRLEEYFENSYTIPMKIHMPFFTEMGGGNHLKIYIDTKDSRHTKQSRANIILQEVSTYLISSYTTDP